MGSCQDRKPREGRAGPRVPGVPRGSGSAPQAADGEGEAAGEPSPSSLRGRKERRPSDWQETPSAPGSRWWRWPGLRLPPPSAHAPAPQRSPPLPCRCPQSGPGSLRPSVGPASLGGRTKRGVPTAGTGSQQGDGKDSREEPRRPRPLPPMMLPTLRDWRCRKGRVLGIAAPGAQRSPLARRLSAGTRRAGAARLGWSPAPGCMLIRWGGGVPLFLRPTTGAGGRAAAAARSQPLPPAPATTARPLALALAQARAPRQRGGARRLAELALGLWVLPAQASGGKCTHTHSTWTEGKAPHPWDGLERLPPISGRAPSVPWRSVSGKMNLAFLSCQPLSLTLSF
ncbi:proline-rich protein 2-like [Meles meles]|uniref:proline-rich protein 2-like n=1 Tax=Meles meles TaxID=9662 RepID=UPI001E69A515|nr:proline-rich protein 2-like [Meles meles]